MRMLDKDPYTRIDITSIYQHPWMMKYQAADFDEWGDAKELPDIALSETESSESSFDFKDSLESFQSDALAHPNKYISKLGDDENLFHI